jgi:mannosyl-oligosaccharide glucosidase
LADEKLFDKTDKLYKDLLIDRNSGDESFSPHRGYVNLMPLALGMINPNNTEVIDAYSEFMRDEKTIWTPYGLRSLEMNDEFFG